MRFLCAPNILSNFRRHSTRRLGNRLKAWVGRLLARKNKPIYDELWTIIHDDLLAACEARAGVRPAPTWFSSDKAPHAFATDDGACAGEVAAYSGGPIDWVTTCKFFSSTLGFGNMRIDGWLDRSSRAPHLAVHLCIVFNARRRAGSLDGRGVATPPRAPRG